MKKLLLVLFIAGILFPSNFTVNATEVVDVYVNGEKLITDQPAIIYQDRTMVPLRAICEALNCEVDWDNDTQTAQIENEVTIISCQIGNYNISKKDRGNPNNIQVIPIDVPPILYNDRTLVPARAISEAIYAIVQWDGSQNRVDITMEFDYIGNFYNNLAAVKKGDKLGFINEKRDIIIPLEYDSGVLLHTTLGYTDMFERGYLILKKDNKWGVINENNAVIVPFKYDMIYGAINSDVFMIETQTGGFSHEYEFINTNGEKIINTKFIDAHPFIDGVAPVRSENGWGYLRDDGTIIVPAIYDDYVVDYMAWPSKETYFIGAEERLLAVRDKEGKIIYYDTKGNICNAVEN